MNDLVRFVLQRGSNTASSFLKARDKQPAGHSMVTKRIKSSIGAKWAHGRTRSVIPNQGKGPPIAKRKHEELPLTGVLERYSLSTDRHFHHKKRHMLTHTGERSHQCEQCGKAFSQQNNLKCHMLTHTGEKPHQCEQCGKAFSRQNNLKLHMLTHTGERPHQCEQCGKAFSRQQHLKRHMLTHTGEKPHQCEQCGKAFSRQEKLKHHMLTHTGEKPHQCEQCGKAFSQQKILKCHMLTHTGERPHQCEQCGKAFSQRANLKTHMLTHNQEKKHPELYGDLVILSDGLQCVLLKCSSNVDRNLHLIFVDMATQARIAPNVQSSFSWS
ncbi:hypothetical protein EMCRGX_G035067 [Ephydatia muelleri]